MATTATVEDLPGLESKLSTTLGEEHRPGTVTVDHHLIMTSVHRDVR